jgi:hypothetical protein
MNIKCYSCIHIHETESGLWITGSACDFTRNCVIETYRHMHSNHLVPMLLEGSRLCWSECFWCCSLQLRTGRTGCAQWLRWGLRSSLIARDLHSANSFAVLHETMYLTGGKGTGQQSSTKVLSLVVKIYTGFYIGPFDLHTNTNFVNISYQGSCVSVLLSNNKILQSFFYFPLYLQSVLVHSANAVKSCTRACRRVLTSTLLYLTGSESSCDLGSETYKLNL